MSSPARTPGIALTLAIALVAQWIHSLPFAPFTLGDKHPIDTMLVAIVLGALARNLLSLPPILGPGIKYSVKGLLPLAIVLMGAKLDFAALIDVSWRALIINSACVVFALLGTVWLCKKLGVAKKLGLLLGVGTAICGGTAIAVTAPVVEADENETAFAVTVVNLLGLAWIFAFPVVGALLSMAETQFGVWAGSSIHATPQVIAAGFAYGESAGEIALIVKLVRVLLLAPAVVFIGIWYARQRRLEKQAYVHKKTSITTLFPPFIIGFVALAAAQSLNLLPSFTVHLKDSFLWQAQDIALSTGTAVTKASAFLVAMAMAGVGLGVRLKGVRDIGMGAFKAGVIAAIALAAFSLGLSLAFV